MKINTGTFIGFISVLAFAATAMAADPVFQCEVLSVKGKVTVSGKEGASREIKTGDLLTAGETIEVGENSSADITYDKDWKNVTHLEALSRVKITSIVPAKLDLAQGAIFSRLKSIPHNSSFDVRTPTAVASVRGTEYWTQFEKGQTQVVNASSSEIHVYGFTPDGKVDMEHPVILGAGKRTSVLSRGEKPAAAKNVTPEEATMTKAIQNAVEASVKTANEDGRVSTIQSVEEIEKYIEVEKKKESEVAPNESELSRVSDTRRRAFGGQRTMAPPEEAPAEKTPSAEPETKANEPNN